MILLLIFLKTKKFYVVDKSREGQLYFMLGYAAAFLAIFYIKTGEKEFLDFSEKYMRFCFSCKDICHSFFSHKVGWAASILYKINKNTRYGDTSMQIAEYFLRHQHVSGLWHENDLLTAYDQSPEISCWLMEMNKNVNENLPFD